MSDDESDDESFFLVSERSANLKMQNVLEENENDKKLIDP